MAGKSLAEQVVYALTAMEEIMHRLPAANQEESNMLHRDFGRLYQETLTLAERRMDRTAYEAARKLGADWMGVYAIPEPRSEA